MPQKNPSRTPVSLDDDWIAAFDDESKAPAAQTPQQVEPRLTPRKRPKPAPAEASGDDWLHALDQSRDTRRQHSDRKSQRPARQDFDTEPGPADESDAGPSHLFDDTPTQEENRGSWLARVLGLGFQFGRPALIGAGGLTAGVVVGLICRPAPTPTVAPPTVPAQSAPMDTAPRELVVAPNGGEGVLTSLAEAVRKAAPGQRIRVKPGKYVGAVVIDKPVEILGDGKPSEVVIESEGGPGLLVKAETATIRGLTVRVKAGSADAKTRGVEVRAGRAVLEDVEIEGASEVGLVVVGEGTAPVVRRVVVRGTPTHALVVLDKAGGFFEGCQFPTGTIAGVLVLQEARPVLRGCEIRTEAGAGVAVTTQGEATLIDCRLSGGAKPGAAVADGGRLRLLDCEVGGFAAEGVIVGKDGEASLEGGRVHGNARAGVAVRTGGRVNLRRCNLTGNTGGEINAEPGCSILSDVPRPQPSALRPPEEPSLPSATRPLPAPTPTSSPQPTSPSAPFPSINSAPIPARPPGTSNDSPEPPPDFEAYRNRPAPR